MIQNFSNILVDNSKFHLPDMICIAIQHIVLKDKVIQYFVLLEVNKFQREDRGK
jgi:hypothetical protein